MSEVEFDRLLDAVRTAVAPASEPAFPCLPLDFNAPPIAANDNQMAWSYIPFPQGWYASC